MQVFPVLLMAAMIARAEPPVWSKCPGNHPAIEEADKALADEKILSYRNALAALEREGAGGEVIACIEDRLSIALNNAGKPREAIVWLRRAAERLLALEPRETTAALSNRLATRHLEMRDFTAAEHWAREALRVAQAVYPTNHPGELSVLDTIATLHLCRQDFARAEPIYRSVLYHLERIYGARHAAVGSAADKLAETMLAQGRHAEAARLYEKAIGVFTSTAGVPSRRLLSVQSGLMVAYGRSGRRELAERLASETLAAAEQQLVGNSSAFGLVLQRIAIVRSLLGDHASARSLCERALRMAEATGSSDWLQLVTSLETYVWILRSAKDKEAARRVESRLRKLRAIPTQ